MTNGRGGESRRSFLKKTALGAFAAAAGSASLLPSHGAETVAALLVIADADDPVVNQPPVQWALARLHEAAAARGITASIRQSVSGLDLTQDCILVGSSASSLARELLDSAGVSMPLAAEALGLVPGKTARRRALLACGSDARGLVYALLELADQIRLAPDPLGDLKRVQRVIQKPANQIRSIARLFTSDVEDKPWFNDRSFWHSYLTELATQRFNRFSLTLGLGYDFTTGIRDAYFHFAYPFLISTPGFKVRAVPLPEEERDHNLEMLRFISEETARRGLHFQLGLWTHAYQWVESPHANYVIEGLGPETHGAYCCDSLASLLQSCPAISGVTFRIHGESGIAEGSYDFWKTVFEGVRQCGRRVEIDLHAKGIDQKMIDLALSTSMPVNVSPKYWAEHMGLGYMQGAIRPMEMPPQEERDQGFFAKSSGSRRFLRYGYGDLLTESRSYGVLHRIWPGTQRLLLWGDPELAANYGRASSFCGSLGVEWCEPLSFKGRKGSGLPGGRDAYADGSLRPTGHDFEKYLHSYRVWGRCIYDPDSNPAEWRRSLRKQFAAGTLSAEEALGQASRILPLVTTVHCPSAANNNYWPEMYTNMPIVDSKRPHPYGDTLAPKRFGAVSTLDPEFFSRIDDFAGELLAGGAGAKYSPAWAAAALQFYANSSRKALASAARTVRDSHGPEFRRLAADVAIASGLGLFFAWKFRAGVLFALYERSRYAPALDRALEAYRNARTAWAEIASQAKSTYRSDVTFGPGHFQRGHWLDRLPAIDADIADMENIRRAHERPTSVSPKRDVKSVESAINAVLQASPYLQPPSLSGFHVPPPGFHRGGPLVIEASLERTSRAPKLTSACLRFRRVNQAEVWQAKEMEARGTTFRAVINSDYTDSPFPLQYHFELRKRSGRAWLFPGLQPGWQGQPYFVVRQS